MNYVTIKCHEETRRLLRLIAADTGEQMVQVMDRLCRDEWAHRETLRTANANAQRVMDQEKQ